MVLAQLPLLPAYRRLKFAPSYWAFTFSWAAVATAGLHWLADEHPPFWRMYSYVVLVAISLLVSLVAARTILALARHQFLPTAHTRDEMGGPVADIYLPTRSFRGAPRHGDRAGA